MKRWGRRLGGRGGGGGGCWSRPVLQLAQHMGDRWKGMPCAASRQHNPSQLSNRARVCKNSRAGPKELTVGMWNENKTLSSLTFCRGTTGAVTVAD